jgi:hypothetical protein
MTWVRIDENFAQHPKLAKAGPLAMAMQVAALCYCNRHLTDGFVPKQIACTLLDLSGLGMRMWRGEMVGGGEDAAWELVVEDLVAVGLWDPAPGGWTIHDYLEYQPSKAQVQRLKSIRSEVGRRGGRASVEQKAEQTIKQELEQKPEQTSKQNSTPYPVPDSVSLKKERSTASPAAPPTREQPPDIPENLDRRKGERFALEALPDDWRAFCKAERPELDPDRIFVEFRDYWIARPGKDGRKLDWFATWRNRVRNVKAPGKSLFDSPKPATLEEVRTWGRS